MLAGDSNLLLVSSYFFQLRRASGIFFVSAGEILIEKEVSLVGDGDAAWFWGFLWPS